MDVQSKILDHLSVADLIRAAPVSASWRLRLVKKLDSLRQAHINFQLDSIIHERAGTPGAFWADPGHIPVAMLQRLGLAWDGVCDRYLSEPECDIISLWTDSKGHMVQPTVLSQRILRP